jgi:hypothetical protein
MSDAETPQDEEGESVTKGQVVRCSVLALVLVALLYWVYDTKLRTPLGPIEDHIGLVQADRMDEALQTMSARFRAETDAAGFKKFVEARTGVYSSTLRTWQIVGVAGREEAFQTGRVTVMCSAPQGATTWVFQLVNEQGVTRIDTIELHKTD